MMNNPLAVPKLSNKQVDITFEMRQLKGWQTKQTLSFVY